MPPVHPVIDACD